MTAKILYEEWSGSNDKPHVIFGGYCPRVCDLLAVTAQSLNVPFLASACSENDQRNHVIRPTYLTFDYYRGSAIPVLFALMETYKWKRLAILLTADLNSFELAFKTKRAIEAKNLTAILTTTTMNMMPEGFTSPEADEEIELILGEIKKVARS